MGEKLKLHSQRFFAICMAGFCDRRKPCALLPSAVFGFLLGEKLTLHEIPLPLAECKILENNKNCFQILLHCTETTLACPPPFWTIPHLKYLQLLDLSRYLIWKSYYSIFQTNSSEIHVFPCTKTQNFPRTFFKTNFRCPRGEFPAPKIPRGISRQGWQ